MGLHKFANLEGVLTNICFPNLFVSIFVSLQLNAHQKTKSQRALCITLFALGAAAGAAGAAGASHVSGP